MSLATAIGIFSYTPPPDPPDLVRLGKGSAMSTQYEDDFDSEEVDEIQSEDSPRGLRRAANKSKKLESELAQTKRELAFMKAGIDPEDSRMKYFVKGYDGEMTGTAVRQAALDAGFLALPPDQSAQSQAIQNSQERVMTASAGAVMEDGSENAAYSRMAAAMEEGGSQAMLEVARQYGIPIESEM